MGSPTTTARAEDAAAVAKELNLPVYPVALGFGRMKERIKQLMETGRDKNRQFE